jgi:predicted secreted hydrolase
LTDINGKKLWHDQRIARASGAEPGQNPLDTASASLQDTGIALRDWSLQRQCGDLRAQLVAADFSLALTLRTSQPVLLQGDHGLSRKGPDPKQTSYYYSMPHLQVSGELVLQGKRHMAGNASTAWLDHEWSNEMLPPQAAGWDWIGINLLDGSALTAFRVRDHSGGALWDGGSFRTKDKLFNFQRGEVVFQPLRVWKSPLSRASYPVEWLVRTPADFYTVRAMLDNQELDSRASTGAIYWEGLCEVWDSNRNLVGRGYLEMTGYAAPIRL